MTYLRGGELLHPASFGRDGGGRMVWNGIGQLTKPFYGKKRVAERGYRHAASGAV